jgi:hypothetical protein
VPAAPAVDLKTTDDAVHLTWTLQENDLFRSVVYFQYNMQWQYALLAKNVSTYSIPLTRTVQLTRTRNDSDIVRTRTDTLMNVAVSVVDRTGNESVFRILPVTAPVDSLSSTTGAIE